MTGTASIHQNLLDLAADLLVALASPADENAVKYHASTIALGKDIHAAEVTHVPTFMLNLRISCLPTQTARGLATVAAAMAVEAVGNLGLAMAKCFLALLVSSLLLLLPSRALRWAPLWEKVCDLLILMPWENPCSLPRVRCCAREMLQLVLRNLQ